MALEIERKFLLKKFPSEIYDFQINIEQFYFQEEERYTRYRRMEENSKLKIKKTIKTNISYGVWEEDETDITIEEYNEKLAQTDKVLSFIKKIRYHKVIGELHWEIDYYLNLNMVICEVELPAIDHPIEIPEFIQKALIKEVTGEKEFSNYKLGEGNEIY